MDGSAHTTERRKPTPGDLVALLSYAAHEAESALTCYQNDRQHDRAGAMEQRLKPLADHLRAAAAHFPPPRRSPWVPGDSEL